MNGIMIAVGLERAGLRFNPPRLLGTTSPSPRNYEARYKRRRNTDMMHVLQFGFGAQMDCYVPTQPPAISSPLRFCFAS